MLPLETYLAENNIDPVRLSVMAGVRYLTVWNAVKGNPITAEHAQKIRAALQRITGTAYTGILVTLPEKPANELPTLPVRKLPEHSRRIGLPAMNHHDEKERRYVGQTKPTLKELLERHAIPYTVFYELCTEVSTEDIHAMYNHHTCTRPSLQKMLRFINNRAETAYTIEDVYIANMY